MGPTAIDLSHDEIYPLTDILKALCLGATAVGIGRPFVYAQSVGSTFDRSSCDSIEISCRRMAMLESSRS